MKRTREHHTRRQAKPGHGRVLLGVLAVLVAQLGTDLAWPPPASAATIEVVYDPDGPDAVDPCSDEIWVNQDGQIRQGPLRACLDGVDRTPDLQLIVEAAADFYAGVFTDTHDVTIYFSWLGPFESLPDGRVLERDDSGRPTEGRIRFPADLTYFYDPTPDRDEEFDMRPRLYRTTHPAEQERAFDGSPPEVLEVSYVGRSGLGADLVSQVLHEMGHALGLSGGPAVGPGPACNGAEDPYFRPDADLMGGSAVGIKAFDSDTPGQQCVHLELGGIQECKTDAEHQVGKHPDEPSAVVGFSLWECASHQALFWVSELPLARTRPGIVGLLALARAGGWEELDLPRKYTVGPGGWAAPSTWIGNRVPGADDDVYIVNEVAGAKVWETPASGASAANLYISDQNTLRTVGSPLHLADEIRIAGPDSAAGPLRLDAGDGAGGGDEQGTALTRVQVGNATTEGVLLAAQGVVEAGGALHLQHPASSAHLGALGNDGVILGRGEVRTSELLNSARVRSVGGTLVIGTPPSDPDDDVTLEPALLDLDGPLESAAEILAVDGDLVFDGIIADPVRATVTVGPERSIHFTNGWHQQWNGLLVLDGTSWPSWVFGDTQLDGRLVVNGVGRFEDDLDLTGLSQVQLSVAGTTMGTEHDFLSVHGALEMGGSLVLELAENYQPAPLDEFVIASYGSRSGEFTEIVGTELDGGLVLVPQYQEQELVLRASFAGASPDDANCTGKAVAEQVAVHGSVKKAADFHGLTVPELQSAFADYCAG